MSETPITPDDPDIPDEPPDADDGSPETDDQPLGPPAELDPHDVVRGIDPEARREERLADRLGHLGVVCGHRHGGRNPARHFRGE